MEGVDSLITDLRTVEHEGHDAIKNQLLTLARGDQGMRVREHLETIKRGELLEIQWTIDEILEETAPAPATSTEPEPEPTVAEEPPADDPGRRLTAADLDLVYDDPRGFMLHKSKTGNRWFATQVDPQTAQPQTFELQAQEIEQIRTQLLGSPHWLIGN